MKFLVFAGVAALCAAPALVSGQPLPKDYPNKPIHVIVPHPAGGPPDLIMKESAFMHDIARKIEAAAK